MQLSPCFVLLVALDCCVVAARGLFLGEEQNSSTNHHFTESVAPCKARGELQTVDPLQDESAQCTTGACATYWLGSPCSRVSPIEETPGGKW